MGAPPYQHVNLVYAARPSELTYIILVWWYHPGPMERTQIWAEIASRVVQG